VHSKKAVMPTKLQQVSVLLVQLSGGRGKRIRQPRPQKRGAAVRKPGAWRPVVPGREQASGGAAIEFLGLIRI
jgi:hypothetical protein